MPAMGEGVKNTLDYTDEGFGFSLPFATNYEKTLLGFVDTESMSASRPELFRLRF